MDVRDSLEEFLRAEIPREISVGGTVQVGVARALAWYIASHGDGQAAVEELSSYVVECEKLGVPDFGNGSAAEYVQGAISFLRDQNHQRMVFERVMGGATAEEAVKDVDHAA